MTAVQTYKITYEGSPARVGLFAKLLRDEGVQAEYEPPIEERGVGQEIAQEVLVILLATGTVEGIKLAMRKFRGWAKGTKFKIDDKPVEENGEE